jgi:hypothetical protein
LYYKQLLLSEGAWRRQRNEVILFDTHMQHPFYVLVGKDNLINCHLPGDFQGLSLYRINPSDRIISIQKTTSVALFPVIEEKQTVTIFLCL